MSTEAVEYIIFHAALDEYIDRNICLKLSKISILM